MNISEQIEKLSAQRGVHLQDMTDLLDAAETEERDFSDDEQASYDEAKKTVGSLDARLDRLLELEAANAKTAKPVVPVKSGSQLADPASPEPRIDPGAPKERNGVNGVATMIRYLAASKNTPYIALELASRAGDDEIASVFKAAVEPVATDQATDGEVLVPTRWSSELIELLRPRSVLERFVTDRMDFAGEGMIRIPRQTGGTAGGYVGENAPIPVGKMTLDHIELVPKKYAIITSVSSESLRRSTPAIEGIVRSDLIDSAALVVDNQFLFGVATPVAPEGLQPTIPGALQFASAGTTLDNVDTDLRRALAALRMANIPMTQAAWIMNPRTTEFLRQLRNPQGVYVFKDEINAGTLHGIRIIDSTTVPVNLGAGTDESVIFLADASCIYFAEELGFQLATSTEAMIQMDTAPTQPVTAASLRSAFQNDLTHIRLMGVHDFKKKYDDCACVITGVTYGA